MKKTILFSALISCSFVSLASSTVIEGVIEKAEVITGEIGQDGHPILGAAVGVGIGSAFGSGSGKDAAKIVGGLIGARRQAAKKKQTAYGWRYIVKAGDQLHVVDDWCPTPSAQCPGIVTGKAVYVINGNEVSVKQ